MKSIKFFIWLLLPFSLFAAQPGSVIITEIMQNPADVSDTNGEWFELYNTTDQDIDINSWTIRDTSSDEHVIDNGGPLIIAAKGFLVLGRNGDSSANGRYHCDYDYSGFTLGNKDDEIILLAGTVEIDRVEYSSSIWPVSKGNSIALINFTSDNNNGANWTASQSRQPSFTGETGDLGSPGTLGVEQTLPVLLLSFSAQCREDGVLLHWTTGQESDNLGFKVQRSGEKQMGNFQTVSGLIPGKGNSFANSEYEFLDKNVIPGQRCYYRLLDIAFDGRTAFHPAIEVTARRSSPVKFELSRIYPNPVSVDKNGGKIHFKLNRMINISTQSLKIAIYNILGEKIFQTDELIINENGGSLSFRLPVGLNTGTYFVQIKAGKIISRKKLLILN